MTDPTLNLVKAAYEPVVKAQLGGIRRWQEMFPQTPEDRERLEQARRDEDDRILSLMRDHLCVDIGAEDILLPLGTTSVVRCACGHVLYGGAAAHLIHVYTVAASDFTNRWGLE